MAIQKLRQANKLTQARYELSLIEKRVIYLMIKEVRKKYILTDEGQKDLFGDLILFFNRSQLEKAGAKVEEVYSSLEKLRTRHITIEDKDNWLNVGFINYSEHYKKKGIIEVQVSKKILPYLVELAGEYTEYSLTVALSLNSEYSQRFYEYCAQWRNKGGFPMTIDNLRKQLCLGKKYPLYSNFKFRVLETAKKELKKLYDIGQCDLYFNYSEIKEGRKVVGLTFKVISNEKENKLSLDDLLDKEKEKWKENGRKGNKPTLGDIIEKGAILLKKKTYLKK